MKYRPIKYITILSTIVISGSLLILIPDVSASTLTHTSIQELGGTSYTSPLSVGTGQQLAIAFQTVNSGATSATINFNNFNGGTVNTTQTVSSTGCTTYFPSATALPGSLTASGSGNVITISGISALSANTAYCTVLTSTTAVTNPSTSGIYSAVITVGSDSQSVAFDVLSAGANSYTVTGTVLPTFTLTLSSGTDVIGNLSASSTVISSGVSATVNTNALSGWNLYAMDSNAGLKSIQSGYTIPSVAIGSNHTMFTGSDQYALGVSANNTASYAFNGGTTGGGLSNSSYNEIATNASPANNVSQTLHELVDISPTTPPATDYTDTITVIGSGSF